MNEKHNEAEIAAALACVHEELEIEGPVLAVYRHDCPEHGRQVSVVIVNTGPVTQDECSQMLVEALTRVAKSSGLRFGVELDKAK